jgi:AAA domain
MNNTQETLLTEVPKEATNPFAERANAQEESKPKPSSLLSTVTRKRRRRPVLGVVAGPPGVGKSTLLSMAPNVIFSPIERGLDSINVSKFPIPSSLKEFRNQYLALLNEEHSYEAYVIDTLDAVEPLVWEKVTTEGRCKSVEEYGGGYQKGYIRAKEIFIGMLNELLLLSEKMNVWMICHSQLKAVNDPTLSTAYDVYDLKLHPKATDVVQQKVDCILFGKMEISVSKDSPKARKGRAINTGDRLLYCQPQTGVMAKNRYDMPDTIEFSYEAIEKCLNDFWNK